MADVTIKQMALLVSFLGVLSFILGVIAKNKKPAFGTPVTVKGRVFPADPTVTVALGYLSVAFHIASTVVGYRSLFYPYKGKSVPQGVMFKDTSFLVFFNVALFSSGLAATLILWPTITQHLHLTHKSHDHLNYTCLTAITRLLGGSALLALDSCLNWLVALMLADNAREDFFSDEDGDDLKVSSNAYGVDIYGVNGSGSSVVVLKSKIKHHNNLM